MASKYDCPACKKQVTGTKNDRYRSHSGGDGEPCEMSSEPIPEHVLAQPVGKDDAPDVPREGIDFAVCPQCDRKVKLTRLGYFEPHDQTLRGGDRCPVSGVRAKHARKTETVPLPGDEKPKPGAEVPKVRAQEEFTEEVDRARRNYDLTENAMEPLALPAGSSASTDSTSPESATTSTNSRPVHEYNLARDPMVSATSSDAEGEKPAAVGPFHLAPLLGDGSVLQPFSHVFQPFPVPPKATLKEALTDDARERVTRFKEIFFSYGNRRSSDNRSAQTTLGPSEIGHECDRRLAMSLLGVEPVNPGGDGWAAWLGTQGHRGLEEIFTWASANTGRFATELRLKFDSRYVPKGTTDILDRQTGEVGDFKFMGEYPLKKLIQNGPPPHYRVQLQVYALGVEAMGEKVRSVALYGLPRAGSSLDGMYVWTAPYDRKEARAALDRVDRIAQQAEARTGPGTPRSPLEVARSFEVVADCRFCPFYLKGDKEMNRGCPGK